MAHNAMTLPAPAFMPTTTAVVVLATAIWFAALASLVAMFSVDKHLPSRRERLLRMARKAGRPKP